MQKLPWQSYVAELIGTGVLTTMVLTAIVLPLAISVPVVAGLTVGILVYTIGSISGTHINPAVTIGLWSIGKISRVNAMGYIVAQILGGVAAMALFGMAFDLPSLETNGSGVLVAEAFGAAILLFGISAVVYGKVSDGASGLTIGGSLLLGILAASTGSNGVLNPAVAIGIGSVSWAYLLGPIVGAILACQLYRWLAKVPA